MGGSLHKSQKKEKRREAREKKKLAEQRREEAELARQREGESKEWQVASELLHPPTPSTASASAVPESSMGVEGDRDPQSTYRPVRRQPTNAGQNRDDPGGIVADAQDL